MAEHGFVVPSLLLPSEGGTEYGRPEDESRNRSVRKLNLKLHKIERAQTKNGYQTSQFCHINGMAPQSGLSQNEI